MRKLVLAAACCAAATVLTSACAGLSPTTSTKRIVILGIDGMDPGLTRGWIRDKRLPNLARLAARGAFYSLESMAAADCDAAWSSFAAGRLASKPAVTHEPAKLLLNFMPIAGEKWHAVREGTPFWNIVGSAGLRSSVLAVPGTFPPAPIENGELLAGSPLPDIRRTKGTYQFFGTTVTAKEEGVTKNGGILRRLVFTQRVAETRIVGPLHPVSRDELFVPMTITWNHEARSVNVQLGSDAVHLKEREWSRLLEVSFPVNAVARVHGFTQLYLIRAGTELELYVSPVQWHPDSPPAPISSPASFANELYDRLGVFRTNGWNAATAALNDERIDEAAFLDDIERAFQDRAETILNRIDAAEWHLLIGVIETPDRVQHMMWRLIDPTHPRYDAELARRYRASIEHSYQQVDELLGQIIERVPADTIIMVVSDHGFHTLHSPFKWSGDHTSRNPDDVAGVLITNAPLTTTKPRLIDLAPTVLKLFGIAQSEDYEGRPLH